MQESSVESRNSTDTYSKWNEFQLLNRSGVFAMALLIFESIGMSELVLIGIVALIIFGPRKLPQIARKAGKTMNELRKVTGEFKETWEKEIELSELEEPEKEKTVPRPLVVEQSQSTDVIEMPKVSTSNNVSVAEQPKLFETTENKERSPNSERNDSGEVANRTDKGEWL